MKKKFIMLAVFIPLATFGSPTSLTLTTVEQPKANQHAIVVDDRAQRIDAYFTSHDMPLAGYGKEFVAEADANGIDWRLLPAISVKESSGGLHMCSDNPFGFGSCKFGYKNIDQAIAIVSANLGGKVVGTSSYYAGDTNKKLIAYNGTVEPLYPERVEKIMSQF